MKKDFLNTNLYFQMKILQCNDLTAIRLSKKIFDNCLILNNR